MRATRAICGASDREAFRIGPANPRIGERVRVRWLKPCDGKPEGFELDGILRETFCVGGRKLVGVITDATGRKRQAPWSRNYLQVEVLPRGAFEWPDPVETPPRPRGI